MMHLYEYKANVVEVYDGDTIRVDIDLGFGVWKHNEPIRLLGLDAPEVRGDEREQGLVVRDALRELIGAGEVIIRTEKDASDKYGRYLGEIFIEDEEMGLISINQRLLDLKLVEPMGR